MNRESLFAGILIGLGAVGYLALGGLPGAVIFSFGLMSVIYFGVPLYTGQAGVTKDLWFLTKVWFFNVLGCVLLGLLALYPGGDGAARAADCVHARLAKDPFDVFLRAAGCGLIIDCTVFMSKTKASVVPVLLGVPLFIVCGFYHSIADVVYLIAAGEWSPAILWYYPMIVVGNYVGCNVRRVTLPAAS